MDSLPQFGSISAWYGLAVVVLSTVRLLKITMKAWDGQRRWRSTTLIDPPGGDTPIHITNY